MADREKVIRHIAAEIVIAQTRKKDFASVDIDMLSDALTLLKEQEAVVRCKDCIYLNSDTGICIVGIPHGYKDTFYCAYGRRR